MAGSAAEKAGIRKNDVVIAIDGTEITGASSLKEKVNSYHPGDNAQVTVIRDGKEIVLSLTFQGDAEENGSVDSDGSVAFYGAWLRDASKETLARYRLKHGVEIVSLGDGKMKAAGAQEGFLILYVNEQPVRSAKELVEIARKSKRAVFIEGLTASGRSAYFGFGKDDE